MSEPQPCNYRVGTLLRSAREASDLSREALAQRVSVSTSTITRLELEDRLPHVLTLRMIANTLGVDIRHVLDVAAGEVAAS